MSLHCFYKLSVVIVTVPFWWRMIVISNWVAETDLVVFAVEMKLMLSNGCQPDSMSQPTGDSCPRVDTYWHLTIGHLIRLGHLQSPCVANAANAYPCSETTNYLCIIIINIIKTHGGSEITKKEIGIVWQCTYTDRPSPTKPSCRKTKLNYYYYYRLLSNEWWTQLKFDKQMYIKTHTYIKNKPKSESDKSENAQSAQSSAKK